MIGVADPGDIVGIEHDFQTLGRKRDRDGWLLAFRQAIDRFLGQQASLAITVTTHVMENGMVAHVRVPPGEDATWLRDGDSYEFYVRNGPASVPLDPPEAVDYIRRRFWESAHR